MLGAVLVPAAVVPEVPRQRQLPARGVLGRGVPLFEVLLLPQHEALPAAGDARQASWLPRSMSLGRPSKPVAP
jgi:hypothetical protein